MGSSSSHPTSIEVVPRGDGIAISLGACFNAAWLWWLMRKSGVFRAEPGWAEFLFKVAVALYLMGGVLWYGMGSEGSWFAMSWLSTSTFFGYARWR